MQKVEFKSKDGLLITADFYEVTNSKGLILLCHRSHCNRAEYRETAPKFNALGYTCLAIDQRSGMKVFGESNETKIRAKAQKLPTGYLDAQPDIEAAIEYAYQLNGNKPIILLGSSYSAALSLRIAKDHTKLKALIVFSAGEHLKGVKLAEEIQSIKIPVFATSAKTEIKQTEDTLQNVAKQLVTQFKPKETGFHGSKILWESVKGYEKIWAAMETFLDENRD